MIYLLTRFDAPQYLMYFSVVSRRVSVLSANAICRGKYVACRIYQQPDSIAVITSTFPNQFHDSRACACQTPLFRYKTELYRNASNILNSSLSDAAAFEIPQVLCPCRDALE